MNKQFLKRIYDVIFAIVLTSSMSVLAGLTIEMDPQERTVIKGVEATALQRVSLFVTSGGEKYTNLNVALELPTGVTMADGVISGQTASVIWNPDAMWWSASKDAPDGNEVIVNRNIRNGRLAIAVARNALWARADHCLILAAGERTKLCDIEFNVDIDAVEDTVSKLTVTTIVNKCQAEGEDVSFDGSGFALSFNLIREKLPVDVVVNGPAAIATASTAAYTCMATWNDGTTSTVTPTWSLSSTAYAAVSTTGVVTNKNTTTNEQTATLNASYTVNGVTKTASKSITLSKKELTGIAISGDATIATASTATYTCTASWSYGGTTTVTPTWSVTPTTYASVSTAGVVTNKNTTTTDQTATLKASYAINGVTKTASKSITLAKKELTAVAISGDATIATGSTATYTCTATWSYGGTTTVTPTWTVTPTTYASVSTAGVVTNKNTTTTDQTATLKASYSINGVTKTASKTITLAKKELKAVAISGDATIATASTATYTCTASWSYGGTTTVTPTWTVTPTTYASVSTAGVVTNKNTTTTDQSATLNASYSINGVTKTASKSITLAKKELTAVAIGGDATIATGSTATYTCTASWSYGGTTTVTPTWSITPTTYASVSASGVVTNKNTTATDQTATLNATYTVNGVTKTASKTITLETGAVPDTQTLAFEAGWNWVGFHVLPESRNVGDVLGKAGFTANDVIQTNGGMAIFTGASWMPGSFTIDFGKLYQIYVSSAKTVTIFGEACETSSVSLTAGWNWIGNPTTVAVTPADLAHSGGWSAGDRIQSPDGTVMYTGGKWVPAGFTLEPGKGCQIFTVNEGTLTFPSSEEDDALYAVVDLSGGPDAAIYPVRYSSTGPNLDDDTCRTTELWLRKIPAGTFIMGSPEDELGRLDNETQHEVTLTQDYYMGVFECTQRQWELVMGSNPSSFKGDCRPVESVSYNKIRGTGAQAGAGWPAYYHTVDSTSFMGKLQAKTGLMLDLPTEAQWEYACRAGTKTALNSGKNLESIPSDANMDEVGRYSYNRSDGRGSYSQHTTVGSYLPNAWGLYDMHGNVEEWCLDWYESGTTTVSDPVGPTTGLNRVLRDGNWADVARYCRSAHRYGDSPLYGSYRKGFRIALHPKQDLYAVVDLSGGPDAASYPVRYTNTAPNLDDDTCRTTELWLRKIPKGTFIMGSPEDEVGRYDDETQHEVTLTQDYYMGVFGCTQRQWELVMGTRPSYFNNETYYATRPVEQVSYNMIRGTSSTAGAGWPAYGHAVDASSFMGKLRSKTGLMFDLPTEAQWEYACRAGTTTALNSEENLADEDQEDPVMNEVGRYWYNGGQGYSKDCTPANGTTKVGSYLPNAWGLYDMHGNVEEWCLDWYDSYGTDAMENPKGANSGSGRVIRGGNWFNNASGCRSAYRYYGNPSSYYGYIGFRVACLP